MNQTIAATKARKEFFNLVEKANRPGFSVTITVDGEAKVVMMSAEEFEGWRETLEIMEDKTLVKGIEEGLRQIAAGKTHSFDAVKKSLRL